MDSPIKIDAPPINGTVWAWIKWIVGVLVILTALGVVVFASHHARLSVIERGLATIEQGQARVEAKLDRAIERRP